MSTVVQLLVRARAAGVDRLDAQLLLAQRLACDRAWLAAHPEAPVDDARAAAFDADCGRRAAGEPLAYVLGRWSFHGLDLQVGPAVLVPRPETELLLEWALEVLAPPRPGSRPRVVDLGTGSGALALALRAQRADLELFGVDASPAALSVASANGQRLGLEVHWCEGDWWQALPGGRFELAVANPPYVRADDPHLSALAHEPRSALVADEGGLGDLRRIVEGAAAGLTEGGWLLLEHGHDQAHAVQALLARHGLQSVQTRADLAGLARCTAGRRP